MNIKHQISSTRFIELFTATIAFNKMKKHLYLIKDLIVNI